EHTVADLRHRHDATNADGAAHPPAAVPAIDAWPACAAVAALGLVAGEPTVLDREDGAGSLDKDALVIDKKGAADVGRRGVEPGATGVAVGHVAGKGAVRHHGAAAAPDGDATAVDGPIAGECALPDRHGRAGVAQDPAARAENTGAGNKVVGELAVRDRES